MQSEKLGQYLFLNESLVKCKRPRRKAEGFLAHWHFFAIVAGIAMIAMAYMGH